MTKIISDESESHCGSLTFGKCRNRKKQGNYTHSIQSSDISDLFLPRDFLNP